MSEPHGFLVAARQHDHDSRIFQKVPGLVQSAELIHRRSEQDGDASVGWPGAEPFRERDQVSEDFEFLLGDQSVECPTQVQPNFIEKQGDMPP